MMILLTGGSGCGKSAFAERICAARPLPRTYIAAMRPYGEGSREKIERHRRLREGKGFHTVERYTDMESLLLPEGGTALLECVCNLCANEMFDDEGHITPCTGKVLSGIENLRSRCGTLVVVTNEVGADGEDYGEGTRAYIRAVGEINRVLAERADCVIEMVCGIPVYLKGSLESC